MTKITTNFIKSKMNKDLDDRLLPTGEYRDATNIAISASEGDSVGTVETILGNVSVADFGYANNPRVFINGNLVDEVNNTMYIFLTDYTDSSSDTLSYFAPSNSICQIWSFNFSNNKSNLLVSGNFLNLSLTHPVISIDIIENLLFFTDNRNQPRKINVEAANPNFDTVPSFYVNEDQISVAKYYPFQAIDLIKDVIASITITNSGGSGNPGAPSGYYNLFNNGNGNGLPCVGGTGFGLTVNITSVSSDGSITGVEINNPGLDYTNGNVVSVAPKTGNATLTLIVETQSTMRDRCNEYLPPSITGNIVSQTGSTTLNIDSGLTPTPAQTWKIENIDAPQTGPAKFNAQLGGSSFNMQYPIGSGGAPDTIPTEWITGNTLTFSAPNPDYISDWPGDCEYLKNKFVRFSYRYKFIDNEYSLSAPFTQECFVPRQDGYIQSGDEQRALDATDLEFFTNSINEIDLIIPCPTSSYSTLNSDLHVSSIEILYKESQENVIKVVAEIPFQQFIQNTTKSFIYTYQSRAPYKVLSTAETTRVSDSVPVKAQSQAISGNRIIYGNYLNRHTSLDTLDYKVGIGDKPQDAEEKTQQEYQNHTLKQNRTYQVGIVLADRYGRQSDVILSSVTQLPGTFAGVDFGGSTVYAPFKPQGFETNIINAATTWPGDNLIVLFNSPIPNSYSQPGYPGVYAGMDQDEISNLFSGSGYSLFNNPVATTGGNGTGLTVNITQNNGAGNILQLEIASEGSGYLNGDVITITGGSGTANFVYNPLSQPNHLGWYSYKIVVKQQEQEYYNAYLPGILNGSLDTSTSDNSSQAKISIFSDNINKIPKDLSDVGPAQVAFRSNELLSFRVNNFSTTNKQYYPGTSLDKVVQIGTMSDLGIANPGSTQKLIASGQGPTPTVIFLEWTDEDDVPFGSLVTAVDSSGVNVSGLEESDEVYVLAYYKYTTSDDGAVLLSQSVTVSADDVLSFLPPLPIYNAKNNPFIGTVSTNSVLGTRISNNFSTQLTVAETLPVFSNLNIYWETTTSGLVSELNDDINSGTDIIPIGLTQIFYNQNEGMASGSVVTNAFFPRDSANAAIQNVNSIGTLLFVTDGNNNNRLSDFTLENLNNGSFRIKTNNTFAVTSDSASFDFTFKVQVEVNGYKVDQIFQGSCDNIAPIWEDADPLGVGFTTITVDRSLIVNTGAAYFYEFTNVKNGSLDSGKDNEGLQWEVIDIKLRMVNAQDAATFTSNQGVNGVVDGSSLRPFGTINQLGYVMPTIYPFVPTLPDLVNPNVYGEINVGAETPSSPISLILGQQTYFDSLNNPSALPSQGNGLGGQWDQNGQYNLSPSNYGTAVFGTVDSQNSTKLYLFPKFDQAIGVGVNFTGPFYQADYNLRLTDGGGLSTDYLVKLIITQT